MNFGKVLTAMVTPFDSFDEIDYSATRNLINHLIANGSDGLIVAGTTGESATLTLGEKEELFQFVVDVTDGRATVLAGTGTNGTKASIELTQIAQDTGVDGIMLVNPYYNKPSQEGLYQHFKAIAASTHLPIMLYNIPGRSAVNMLPETILRLSEIDNIVSVKEASGDLDAMTQIIHETPENFSLYSGDDGLLLPVLAIGGVGVVSVSAHIIGNEFQQLISMFENGHYKEAGRLNGNLRPLIRAMFAQPSPGPVKAALNMYGITVGDVRLPMLPLTESEMFTLKQILKIDINLVS